LRSIEAHLGTDQYPRLRVGVGRGDGRRDLGDHVLARFEPDERVVIDEAVSRAADAMEAFIDAGIEVVMNRYNRKEDKEDKEEQEQV
jgi:PTH1 family peptidyl-tRNA hydrolase